MDHSEEREQGLCDGEPPSVAFQPGIPAFDAFPRLIWARLLRRHGARSDQFILDYAHIGGYAPLRQALVKYLNASRGLTCDPEQVILVTSVRAAIAAVCAVLWRTGSGIAIEDPGYVTAKKVLAAAGMRLHPVPVDDRGIRVDHPAFDSDVCAGVYITPGHQWPTGVTLSAERRLQLLDWAAASGAWIMEDDYDSEFRFDSPPVAPLHTLGSEHVIYTGTFSKTLAPSIRTDYLVVPSALVDQFAQRVYQSGTEPSLHIQAAPSDFIAEGDFVRHIAQMRKLYRRRRDLLISGLKDAFGDRISTVAPPGGASVDRNTPKEGQGC